MEKNRAEHQARLLIAANGLDPNLFKWNRGKSLLGQMGYNINHLTDTITITSISLSSYWTEAMSEDEVREIMLHEIAHALLPRENHGWRFKQKVRELGGVARDHCYSPSKETRARMEQIAPPLWVGSCKGGHTVTAHRAPTVVRSCGKCSRKFSVDNLIVWVNTKNQNAPLPTKYVTSLVKTKALYGAK